MTLRLAYANFWNSWRPADCYFTRLLGARWSVEIVGDRADVAIFSGFGPASEVDRLRPTVRVFYTGEGLSPDMSTCDYALSFDHSDDPRHYRLPVYAFCNPARAIKPPDFDPADVLASKTRFCQFLTANPSVPQRNEFYRRLSRYKKVDAAGPSFHDMPADAPPWTDKIDLLRRYKFTIAFENQERQGYTTEKVFEPMLANSVPIYWGNPLVGRDFNTRSFLSAYDCDSLEALALTVEAIDRNDDRYVELLREPWYRDNRVNADVDERNVLAFFEAIVAEAASRKEKEQAIA